MNFYKHHLGDYSAATGHLSWLEDLAYTRLLRAYYLNEKPLPADPEECCRLARARTRREKEAVKRVLAEFFVLTDAHHNKRCDDEIASYNHVKRQNSLIAQHRESTKRARSKHETSTSQNPDTRNQNKTPSLRSGTERASKRCPANFSPTPEMLAWAATEAPRAEVCQETEKFKDYTFASAKSDWPATWRNWMRKASESKRTGASNGKQKPADILAESIAHAFKPLPSARTD